MSVRVGRIMLRCMRAPVGFFITWTCYGTWLYGERRGSVDRDHSTYDTPLLPSRPRRVVVQRDGLKDEPVELDRTARSIVVRTVEDHCERRGWELIAVNARSNHVHVVVCFADVAPEVMMGQLKSWCSRRLRERRLFVKGRRIWTRHGSTRYLWKQGDIESAARYVLEGQDGDRFALPRP